MTLALLAGFNKTHLGYWCSLIYGFLASVTITILLMSLASPYPTLKFDTEDDTPLLGSNGMNHSNISLRAILERKPDLARAEAILLQRAGK